MSEKAIITFGAMFLVAIVSVACGVPFSLVAIATVVIGAVVYAMNSLDG